MAVATPRKFRRARRERIKPEEIVARLANAICAADGAAQSGNLAAAERWTRIADRLAVLAQRLTKLPAPQMPWEEAEKMRAELRERYRRMVLEPEG